MNTEKTKDTENAPCGAWAFKKISDDGQKIWLRKLYFKHTEAQRHRDYFEHGKLEKNGNFRLFREFRVQKNINVRINVLICVLINVSP